MPLHKIAAFVGARLSWQDMPSAGVNASRTPTIHKDERDETTCLATLIEPTVTPRFIWYVSGRLCVLSRLLPGTTCTRKITDLFCYFNRSVHGRRGPGCGCGPCGALLFHACASFMQCARAFSSCKFLCNGGLRSPVAEWTGSTASHGMLMHVNASIMRNRCISASAEHGYAWVHA